MNETNSAVAAAAPAFSTQGTCYQVTGCGRPVVLIHGVGLDQHMWAQQVACLSQYYQVITYDMLGHGRSPPPPSDASLKTYADQLHALLAALHIKRALVIGFSMGGLVARAFALHYPAAAAGLAILNSVYERTPQQQAAVVARAHQVALDGPAANVEAALQRWFSDEYRRTHAAQLAALRQTLLNNDKFGYLTSYRLFAREDRYLSDQLGSIRVPVLVATGEYDSGSTPAMSKALAGKIPGARVAIVPGQKHMMVLEAREQVNALLLAFLQDAFFNHQHTEELRR